MGIPVRGSLLILQRCRSRHCCAKLTLQKPEPSELAVPVAVVPGGAPLPEADEAAVAYLAFLESLPPTIQPTP